jgi:hypothetical protein
VPVESDRVATERARMVAEIKEQLGAEMGLVPLSLIRERRQLRRAHTYDNHGQKNYGRSATSETAATSSPSNMPSWRSPAATPNRSRAARSPRSRSSYEGQKFPRASSIRAMRRMKWTRDWAIIKTREPDLPALTVDTSFSYEFAAPIFRLGNDYSKGVVVSTGYVGQRTPTGLVTSLTDGHPGVSGGGSSDHAACWSAFRSDECRATTASRSSCRSAPTCSARRHELDGLHVRSVGCRL